MRFTFLGTGTSSGIPMIGCDCAVCMSADPRDRRLRTAGALEFTDHLGGMRTILFDAGPDLREQALRFGIKRCDAVLVTHNHVDHIWGMDELRRFNAVQQESIPIYADEHAMDNIRRVYKHIFESHRNVNDSFVANLIPWTLPSRDIDNARELNIHGLRVTPFRLLHGKLPILGYRIDPGIDTAPEARKLLPLAYCTDVSGIPPESWGLLSGLKTLILDALRHRKHPTHFTLEEAVSVASRVDASQTYFIHMAHELAHEETSQSLPDRMWLAYDGLRIGDS